MARPRRVFTPGVPQHVIQRGNHRREIFRCDVDYEMFLMMLHDALNDSPLVVHGYVLMTNHVHMMVTPGDQHALPRVMQSVGRRYVPYFNKVYQCMGGLFEARYKSLTVDDDRYWYTCMRYIELNPVRAGLAAAPDQYPWTSFHANGYGKPDSLITPHVLYSALGRTSAAREESWRRMCAEALPERELAAMRDAVATGRFQPRVAIPETAGI